MAGDIKEIAKQISEMTLGEVKELLDELKTYGIEPSVGSAVIQTTSSDNDKSANKEKTSFNLFLKSSGSNKIAIIKIVKTITNSGLKEAKDIVDNAPSMIKEGLSKDEANSLKEQLEAQGAEVELQ